MVRKWPTNSLKTQACILRRDEHLTDDEIYQRFIKEGKMVQPHVPPNAGKLIDQINADVLHKHPPQSHDESLIEKREKITDITEDTWKAAIIELYNSSEQITPSIVDKIRDYLDKKNAISRIENLEKKPAQEDSSVLTD